MRKTKKQFVLSTFQNRAENIRKEAQRGSVNDATGELFAQQIELFLHREGEHLTTDQLSQVSKLVSKAFSYAYSAGYKSGKLQGKGEKS